jgi:hypothetical protein
MKKCLTLLGYLFAVLLFLSYSFETQKDNFPKPFVFDYAEFDANNIRAYVTNYGSFFRHPRTGNSGFEWPTGSKKYEIYSAGLWVGAKINDEVRIAIAEYAYEYAPGTINIETHLPNNPENPTYRVYKIEQGNTSSWDYQNWPYWDGAPLDVNGNPLPIANQTLWCVYNDADSAVHTRMKSKPLGIEIQQTVFGWNVDYLNLQDVVFLRFLVINKSREILDSTYLTVWCDSDLGDSGDDMTGTDSLLQLGFVYNHSNFDGIIGEKPPAVGITFLQGPIVPSPADTAIFYGKKRPGYKNLLVNSIVCPLKPSMYNNGSPRTFQDAYNLMQARWKDGSHMTYGGMGDDSLSSPINFMYTGDPVAGTGWLDPYPADKRFMLNCGPLIMAPGDSQEVIYAVHIAQGTSHLNSLTELKQQSQNLHSAYPNRVFRLPQNYEYEISYPADQQIDLKLSLQAKEALEILSEFYTYGTSDTEDTLLKSFNFYNDGQHDDGEANDGAWGASITSATHPNGGYLNMRIIFSDGETITFEKIKEKIPLAGNLEIVEPVIGSDNLNNDGLVNPGENIRYTLKLNNQTHYNLREVKITPSPGFNSKLINFRGLSGDIFEVYMPVVLPMIPAQAAFNWEYSHQGSYLNFDTYGSEYDMETDIGFRISLEDKNHNYWEQSIHFNIIPLAYQPEYNSHMNIIEGKLKDGFDYIIINPWELTGHTYQINFAEQEQKLFYNLKDVSTNVIKLNVQPLPDSHGHTNPLVDGFKILKGSLNYQASIAGININPFDNVWLTSVPYFSVRSAYYSWQKGIVLGNFTDKWQGNVPFWEYPDRIKIEFDSTFTTYCKVYRIDQNYQVQPGLGVFHGAAYDIIDTLSSRRLNIVFMENDTLKPADMVWNPDSTALGGEELLLVMNSDYRAENGGGYDNSNFAPEADVLVKAAFALKEDRELSESPYTLTIILRDRPRLDDVFEFTPVWQNTEALKCQLLQNYPNPFNNRTTITYRNSWPQRVKLEIFNVLGQRIETLVDKFQQPRNYSVVWDARSCSSGIYFYRLTAGQFQKTRKFLLIK